MRTRTGRRLGFTLIGILAVIVIMVALTAIVVPAVNAIGNASRLDSAGRLVSNLVAVARSEAINQRTLVQLRFVTSPWVDGSGGDDLSAHYRKVSLWKLDQGIWRANSPSPRPRAARPMELLCSSSRIRPSPRG